MRTPGAKSKHKARSLQQQKKNFLSLSLLSASMASHLASLGKVGPTIGEQQQQQERQPKEKESAAVGNANCFFCIGAAAAQQSRPFFRPRPPPSTSSFLFSRPTPPPLLLLLLPHPKIQIQRPSSASRASASSPSPDSSTTARASPSLRSRPTGSFRRRSASGRWSAWELRAQLLSATPCGGARSQGFLFILCVV